MPIQPVQKRVGVSGAGVSLTAHATGLFSLKAANAYLQNFSANELVIELGRDIFVGVEQKLVPAVFAESSVLLQKLDKVNPTRIGKVEICTSVESVKP